MNRVIIITGGSDGLGKSLAEDLAKDNKVVILANRPNNEEKLKRVASENNCDYFVCDVTDYSELEKVIGSVLDKYDKIDVLINCAGLWIQDELDQNGPERIEDVIKVNLLGVINASKAVIPKMKDSGDGLIINVNSQAGLYYKAERAVYNASKWGVTGFSGSMQPEFAKYGIRVTDLMPGMMKTKMFEKMGIEKNMANGIDTKEIARLVRFIIETSKDVMIPEVGIKNINN